MADKLYYQEEGKAALRGWVFGRMVAGAGYAAIAVFVLGMGLWILAGLGKLLPEESRQTPDPTGALEVPAGPVRAA